MRESAQSRRLAVVLCAAAWLCAAPSRAQPAPDPDDPPVVDALVVTARTPGPPWWKVTKDGATVWILALPSSPTPAAPAFDTAALARRLARSRLYIEPPAFTASLGDLPALLSLRASLKSDVPLPVQLGPDLYARFETAARRIGRAPERYSGWDATYAAQTLRGDVLKAEGLSETDAATAALRFARRSGLPSRKITYKAAPVLKEALSLRSDTQREKCVRGDLDDAETPPARFAAAAQAWARGDARGALEPPRGAEICVNLLLEHYDQIANRDETSAILETLHGGGEAVAFIPLRRLVVQGGVVERLRAAGASVEDPARLSD